MHTNVLSLVPPCNFHDLHHERVTEPHETLIFTHESTEGRREIVVHAVLEMVVTGITEVKYVSD